MNLHPTIPRIMFTIEDEVGKIYTSERSASEARDVGETLAEFDPSHEFFMVPHTLH